jgi:hypothetical protein
VLTKSGLPGWFPEDFSADPALQAAFEDSAEWHATGREQGGTHAHARGWDDLAREIVLASANDHHIAGTPDIYSHGWKLRGTGGGKTELFSQHPTADKMSKTALKQHMDLYHNGGMPIGGRRVGPKNPSKDLLLAWHEAMHAAEPLSVNPPGSADASALGKILSRTSAAHTHGVPGVADHPVTGIALSAETGRLAVTPNPRGKPGGPGLYGKKGNMHSPYMQNIVKALIRGGMDPGHAYAVAWSQMRKWAAGGGKVHPEVRAAAAGGLALEKAAEARAMSITRSSGVELAQTWGELENVIEFVTRPGYQVIELDWAAWDAGERGGSASAKAHDTASRTASRDAKAKIAADRLHSVADQADSDFPSAKPGSEIHAAAESFARGDAEGANAHLDNARAKLRGATEVRGKSTNRFGSDPVVRKQIALDSTLRTGKGQAQMMAQQQDDDARADAKEARKAAKAQAHANIAARNGIDLAAAQARVPAGQAGGGQFAKGSGGNPAELKAARQKLDAHQQHVAHVAREAAVKNGVPQQKQGQSASSAKSSATASKDTKAKIAASKQSKQGLLGQAASDKKQAGVLQGKRKTLQAQLAALSSASGATSSGQAGSTTSAGASTTASSAPATASTAATTAASTASSAAGSAASAASPTAAQLTTQIGALTTQINTLMKQAAQASAQAAKM